MHGIAYGTTVPYIHMGLDWDGVGWDVAGPFACHAWVRSWVGWILKLEVGGSNGTGRDETR